MLLRLFDGHPQVHVHIAPATLHWQNRPKPEVIGKALSMERHVATGFAKTASNRSQRPVDIEFDADLFWRSIDQAEWSTPRHLFSIANAATFDAWTNYRHRGDGKLFYMAHTTIWDHTKAVEALERFYRHYPDGHSIFIARPPDDWLASATRLDGKYADPSVAIAEYISAYRKVLHFKDMDRRPLVIPFNDLVTKPKVTLSGLCEQLGLNYSPTLETTTINGNLIGPNSSHDGPERYAPDPGLIGHGESLAPGITASRAFREATEVFELVTE